MISLFRKQIPVFLQIPKEIKCAANFAKKIHDDLSFDEENRPYFFCKLLDINFLKAKNILEEHPQLSYTNPKDISKTVETLKSLKYSLNEIQSRPMLLAVNSITLENRYDILKECGCTQIPIVVLSKYIIIMNRSIESLKLHSVIPSHINVQEKLEKCFNDVEVKLQRNFDDTILLKILRGEVLNQYLRVKLNATDDDIKRIWTTYDRLKHRNYKSISGMIEILRDDLNFSNERIIKNAYLLYGEPKNARRLLNEVEKIDNEDFKAILYRTPKILMSSCDSVLKTIEYIKSYGISESAILKCLEVLTLGSETVKQRLYDLENVDEFRVLKTNPRYLRLVHYLNKARHRLDYLNQLKIRCASLDILSCGSAKFEKFAREGLDSHKSRDTVIFISDLFQKSQPDVRKFLQRHPNWTHVPITNIKESYDFLISKLFKPDDIYANIYLLLYPVKRIEEKLNQLRDYQFYNDFKLYNFDYYQLSRLEILKLCLYLIESEFHFTGDGIWTEQSIQPVENFSTILPNFFESFPKTYRYGCKPSSSQKVLESESK